MKFVHCRKRHWSLHHLVCQCGLFTRSQIKRSRYWCHRTLSGLTGELILKAFGKIFVSNSYLSFVNFIQRLALIYSCKVMQTTARWCAGSHGTVDWRPYCSVLCGAFVASFVKHTLYSGIQCLFEWNKVLYKCAISDNFSQWLTWCVVWSTKNGPQYKLL